MRTHLQACYRILLKGIGAIGLLVCCVYAMSAGISIDTSDPMYPIPEIAFGTLALSSLAVAACFDRLPVPFARPNRPWHMVVVLPITVALALIAALTVIILVSELGLGHGIQRPMAVNTASVMVLSYVLSALLGAVLSVWDDAQSMPA